MGVMNTRACSYPWVYERARVHCAFIRAFIIKKCAFICAFMIKKRAFIIKKRAFIRKKRTL